MLETLLQIGKTLRDAGRMKHHRFIKSAPLEDKKRKVTYLRLPVRADFSFDFDGMKPIVDEDFIRTMLYYLTFNLAKPTVLLSISSAIFVGVETRKERRLAITGCTMTPLQTCLVSVHFIGGRKMPKFSMGQLLNASEIRLSRTLRESNLCCKSMVKSS
jgi:hypothetical protein